MSPSRFRCVFHMEHLCLRKANRSMQFVIQMQSDVGADEPPLFSHEITVWSKTIGSSTARAGQELAEVEVNSGNNQWPIGIHVFVCHLSYRNNASLTNDETDAAFYLSLSASRRHCFPARGSRKEEQGPYASRSSSSAPLPFIRVYYPTPNLTS